MPMLMTARDIAAEALKEVGAFGVNDREPDPAQLERAMIAFDALVQELAGTEEVWWLRPGELALSLTPGQAAYVLRNELGSAYPANGIEYPLDAYLVDPNGNRRRVEIVRRDGYYDHGLLTTSGAPVEVYIDRLTPNLTLYTYPVIAETGYSIRLSFQTYAPDLPSQKTGAGPHFLPAAWQRWGRLATAYDISGGQVMALPLAERQMLRRDAQEALNALLATNARERAGTGYTKPWGL